MSEIMMRYETVLRSEDGRRFIPRACGRKMKGDRRWEGWIEFESPITGEQLRTGQETVQPDRDALTYWATGLTITYLEGALQRALNPPPSPHLESDERPAFGGPAPRPRPEPAPRKPKALLDPFEVSRQGEDVLKRELLALDTMHLRNIALAHGLADADEMAEQPHDRITLAALIVREVRERQEKQREA